MRHFQDDALHGHAMIFDGPLDMLENTRRANAERAFKTRVRINWPGRFGDSWEDAERFLTRSWPEAMRMVGPMIASISSSPLPEPTDLRRKARWSDTDGEVDVDRALHGDSEFYRDVRRKRVTGYRPPTNVALLCHLDVEHANINASGVYYRSATAIAVADVLERLGYGVEMWAWQRGLNVFPAPNGRQFTAMKFKAAGQLLDVDACVDTLSAWFEQQVVVGSYAACPVAPIGAGSAIAPEHGIGPWMKYLDIEENVKRLEVPPVYGNGLDGHHNGFKSGVRNGTEAAVKILTDLMTEGEGV